MPTYSLRFCRMNSLALVNMLSKDLVYFSYEIFIVNKTLSSCILLD